LASPRPYVAAAAAAVLAALFFVPSASASPHHAGAAGTAVTSPAHGSAAQTAALTDVAHTQTGSGPTHAGLADTGGIDTEPYLIGGAAFLVAGAGLIVNAGRRARQSM
jgi:hypothetical protein